MSTPQRTSSTSSEENTRKRVCKACDRCRLKKSKCDGASPCSRCKADNAICVFGERKKAHDKVYPKGYVEMLEQQQAQLVAGLHETYKLLLAGESWPGKPLRASHGGFPLTHDILERLNVLHSTESMTHEGFEDDLEVLQQRCMRQNGSPPLAVRRRAMSEESEPSLTSSESTHGMSSPEQHSIAFTDSTTTANNVQQKRSPPTPPMGVEYYYQQQKAQQYSMPQALQTNFNSVPTAVFQQAWSAQQIPAAMDIDWNSFNPSLDCDAQLFANPNPFQSQDTAMAMGWPDSFDQLINPNALQAS